MPVIGPVTAILFVVRGGRGCATLRDVLPGLRVRLIWRVGRRRRSGADMGRRRRSGADMGRRRRSGADMG
ncbi:MAG: hypothetical protein QOF88_3174, partial [Mycobacterium sp.]|nr:hypothetical protein [Mycobacterium sp.]